MRFLSPKVEDYKEGLSSDKEKQEQAISVHVFSNGNFDIGEFAHFSLNSILRLIDANTGSLFLWDESRKELVLKAYSGSSKGRFDDIRIKLREGVCGLVADEGYSVLVKDVGQDDRFKATKRMGLYHTSSFMCLPLVCGHKLLGVINITEKMDKLPFSEDDFQQAELFSRHIAVAYDNLRVRFHIENENNVLHQQIEELKKVLYQQERYVSIGKVASSLVHELSNPLDAVRRFVNLALDQVMEDSLAREYLLKAKNGIRRTVNVIRGLLKFSRESYQSQARKTELHTLINESVDWLLQQSPDGCVAIEKNFCEQAVFVQDHGLHLVFKNLFENACHAVLHANAMSSAGKITVGTRRENGSVVISIRDNGTGVPDEIRDRVFEPFFTTKKQGEGTGIGLTICRDIVERCGGKIAVENHSEGGAEFSLTLPLFHHEAEQ